MQFEQERKWKSQKAKWRLRFSFLKSMQGAKWSSNREEQFVRVSAAKELERGVAALPRRVEGEGGAACPCAKELKCRRTRSGVSFSPCRTEETKWRSARSCLRGVGKWFLRMGLLPVKSRESIFESR